MTHENKLSDRDDMYGLTRDGVDVVRTATEGSRMFRLDRPHIFTDDQGGEIVPASLIKAKGNKKIGVVKGKSLKLGKAHSHDNRHRHHILEEMSTRPTDLISRFKRWAKSHRDERRRSRDR